MSNLDLLLVGLLAGLFFRSTIHKVARFSLAVHHGDSSNSSKPSLSVRNGVRKVLQLNESIYELYKPAGVPAMEVLFFHGFQRGDIDYGNAQVTTWLTGDESSYWPQTWLVDEFPGAHILSVSYHVGMKNKKEERNIDVHIITENIMSDLRQANIGQGEACPIILVGHSFGGLVIKDLCWFAHSRSSTGKVEETNFIKNLKGMYFYSTPHHGIHSKLAERFVSRGPLLDYVETLSTQAARRNENFETIEKYYDAWQIAGLGENLPTQLSSREKAVVVVAEGSSRCGSDFEIVQEDHISICRPMTRNSKAFYHLTRFLDKFRNRFGAELPAGTPFPYRESLVSPKGTHTLKNQGDGNLVIYHTKREKVVWASGTYQAGRGAGLTVCTPRGDLKLLTNGNLVLYNTLATGLPVWASMSQGIEPRPHKVVLQDNGSLIIHDAESRPIWSSASDTSSGRYIEVDGKDELPSGVTWMQPFGKLVSPNKMYTFINQGDGNLCLYNDDGLRTWESRTERTGGAGNLYMQRDGNLVLYHDMNGDGALLWASCTIRPGSGPFKLVMQDDGNLVIYDAGHRPTWATCTR